MHSFDTGYSTGSSLATRREFVTNVLGGIGLLGLFLKPEEGTIDFKRILERSRQAGVKHYFVEQDEISGSPFESIKTSYEYLRKMRF